MEINRKKSIRIGAIALTLFLQACTERSVFTDVTPGGNGLSGTVYVLTTGQSNAVPISTVYGPARPCGHLSDGRLVLNIERGNLFSTDIYLADPTTGQVLNSVVSSSNTEECQFVTDDNVIIYSVTGQGWAGHDVMAIKAGSAIPTSIATNTEDEYFLGVAPDKRVVFARRAQGFLYHIMSAPVAGGTPIMLAQVFPPFAFGPMFNGITADNRVIFSQYVEYRQNSFSKYILSVKTDGTSSMVLTKNPPSAQNFCRITNDNRILFTERSIGVVNGQTEYRGDLYSINADSTNRLRLFAGPAHNDTCRGFTLDNRVVFNRVPLDNYDEQPTGGQLYSVVADGHSQPILLADTVNNAQTSSANEFAGVTPGNRVLFTTSTRQSIPGGNTFTRTLNSVLADGTGRKSLTDNINVVGGVTAGGKVIYNAFVSANGPVAYNMFSVPSDGSATPTQLSSSPNLQYLNFIYIQ